ERQRLDPDRRAAPVDAARHAGRRGGVPHRRDPAAGRRQAARHRRRRRRHQDCRSRPDLEHRPGRDPGIRQPDRPGRRHHRGRPEPDGIARRPRPRGLSGPRRRELDEAHPGLEASGRRRPDRLPPGAQLHHVRRSLVHRAQGAGLL
ncbi:hypothetical protein LTR94_032250, partial [Friedmanniomyces endolithicus]